MLFEVTRTSMFGDDKPCDEVKRITLKEVDSRTCKSPEEFDKRRGAIEGKWLENGTNHRTNDDGSIIRDIGTCDTWGIEVDTLEELVDFIKKQKQEIVVGISSTDESTLFLEIYDDYRE